MKRLGASSSEQSPPPIEKLRASSSEQNSPPTTRFTELTDHIYELYRPKGEPVLEILFFHGLQEIGNSDDAYWSTWLCGDTSQKNLVWPATWLAEKFPDAHIFSVAYNACMRTTSKEGTTDLHNLAENLVENIRWAKIGQGRPVILVGHCLGGLVVKKLCVKAHDILSRQSESSKKYQEIGSFLENVAGVFFYGTPHRGAKIAHRTIDFSFNKLNSALLDYVRPENAAHARLEVEFSGVSQKYKMWPIAGVGEEFTTTSRVGVLERSARYSSDFIMVGADHVSVCKPEKKTSSSFLHLVYFISNVVKEYPARFQKAEPEEPEDELALGIRLPRNFQDHERVQLVIEKLDLQNPQPLCLAVIGMGGIGKTTVAKAVLIELSPKFDIVWFVQDVKEEMKNKSVTLVQDLPKGNIYRGHSKVLLDRDQSPWTILKGKRLLLVMDDVDARQQIEDISWHIDQKPSRFGEGSRVIATSRSSLEFPPNFSRAQLPFLSPKESSELFSRYLQPNIAEKMPKDLVEDVVRMCDGLPLTLELIGNYLCCVNNEKIWNGAIERLREAESIDGSSDDKLWAKLKYSFKGLAQSERDMFLDFVAFYDDINGSKLYDRREVFELLKGAQKNPEMSLRNLEERCFIRIKTGRESSTVWIHEQLRGMARLIACPPRKNKNSWTTVWQDEDGQYFLTAHQESSALEVFRIALRENSNMGNLKLPWSRLARLKALRVLSIDNNFYGKKRFQGSGVGFPSNLNLLRLVGCYSNPNDEPSLTQQDWPIREADLNNLTNLMALEISLCGITHGFSPDETGHIQLVSLPAGFHKLAKLRVLYLRYNELRQLPHDFGHLPSLERLIIDDRNLESLPESFGHLSTLRYLSIEQCKMDRLPRSFGKLHRLQTLSIKWCNELDTLPASFGELRALQTLTICDCKNLHTLPDSVGELPALQTLEISACSKLHNLPHSFRGLRALQTLDIWRSCTNLHTLPNSFGEFPALQTLHIDGCWNLRTLPHSFRHLSMLKELKLANCPQLEQLPHDFKELNSLHRLLICNCPKQKGGVALPKSLQEVQQVAWLRVRGWETECLNWLPGTPHRDEMGPLERDNCPMLRELEGLGWVKGPDHVNEVSWGSERIYRRAQDASIR